MVRIVKFSFDGGEPPELRKHSNFFDDDWSDDDWEGDSTNLEPQMFDNPDNSQSENKNNKPNDAIYKKNNPCKPKRRRKKST